VSDSLSPRYHPIYLAVALVARALQQDAIGAMGIAAALNMVLLTGSIFWFFHGYFRDARAPLYAFLVLFMSWWKGWHFSNVYQLQILPSVAAYPSTTGLALSFMGFALVTSIVRGGATTVRLVSLALLSATLLIVHPLTAVMGFAGMGLLALLEPGSSWRVRLWLVLALLGGALCAHFWPYYSAFEVLSGGSHGDTSGWAGKLERRGPSSFRLQPLFYDWQNLLEAIGLALPGLFFAVQLLWQRKHLFAPLGLLCMLAVFMGNIWVPLPLAHRFVLLAMVYLHVCTVWGCLRWSPGYHDASPLLARRPLAVASGVVLAAAFAVASWHNLTLADSRVEQASRRRLSPVLNYARQVGRRAGEGAVVLGTQADTWPVPTFGPKVVDLLHVNPLVPDALQRTEDVKRFFGRSLSDAERDALITKYGVTHVLSGGREAKGLRAYLAQRSNGQRLAGGYRLYTLKPSPGESAR
jgi:hypothetical protein